MRDEAKEEPLVPLSGLEMNVFLKKHLIATFAQSYCHLELLSQKQLLK